MCIDKRAARIVVTATKIRENLTCLNEYEYAYSMTITRTYIFVIREYISVTCRY